MGNEDLVFSIRLIIAVVAGGLIGLERTYHGRPAGFRTHTLVCAASTLLMLLVASYTSAIPDASVDSVRIDPTRMAQGIMTGIGFLGAGVIMKEGSTIRGLTTAASIWMTAAIGIVIGLGFYFATAAATIVALVTLSLFRLIERVLPSVHSAGLSICSGRADPILEGRIQSLLETHRVTVGKTSYLLEDDGRMFRSRFGVQTRNVDAFRHLADALRQMEDVREFSITPTSD